MSIAQITICFHSHYIQNCHGRNISLNGRYQYTKQNLKKRKEELDLEISFRVVFDVLRYVGLRWTFQKLELSIQNFRFQ